MLTTINIPSIDGEITDNSLLYTYIDTKSELHVVVDIFTMV